jgi:hypothetical protein
MPKRKRPSLASIVATCRAAVDAAAARYAATVKYSPEWHAAYRLLTGAQQELRDAERRQLERQKRDAQRKVRARREGRVKPRPPRPKRTIEQEVDRLRKSIATRKERLAELEPDSDAWHRAMSSLQKAERELERIEGLAAGFD